MSKYGTFKYRTAKYGRYKAAISHGLIPVTCKMDNLISSYIIVKGQHIFKMDGLIIETIPIKGRLTKIRMNGLMAQYADIS